jgi:hypothetical protein
MGQGAACGARRAVLVVFALAAGCSLDTPQKTGLLRSAAPEARISSSELGTWIGDAALNSADRIQQAADRIRAETRDPVIRRNALLWKINAIQAGFRAAARRDALSAFADLSALARQMAEFFDTGAGRDVFGPQQAIAIEASETIEARMDTTYLAMMKPESAERLLTEWKRFIRQFAKKYPIESLDFIREPVTGHPESRAIPQVESFGAVVGGLELDVATAQRLLDAYLQYMPSIARWQAELLLDDLRREGVLAETFTMLRDMESLLRDTATRQLPDLVTGQTTRALSAVTAERAAALNEVEKMRAATMNELGAERMTALAEIDRQRLETLDFIRDERLLVLQALRATVRETAETTISTGGQILDHLYWRTALLGGLLLLAVAVGLVVRHRLRSKTPSTL